MIYHRYALKDTDGTFHDFYTNYLVYEGGLVCKGDETVYDVTLEECSESEYDQVAWRPKDSSDIEMIFRSELLLTVCFPYGLKAALNAGQGEVVYLKETSHTPLGKAETLKTHKAKWDV